MGSVIWLDPYLSYTPTLASEKTAHYPSGDTSPHSEAAPPVPRAIQEIEKAFREMGISEGSWGKPMLPTDLVQPLDESPEPQVFIRIEITTTPLQGRADAHLA